MELKEECHSAVVPLSPPKAPRQALLSGSWLPPQLPANNSLAVIFRQFILCPLAMLGVAIE